MDPTSYDYDEYEYDDTADGGRILWGRVAVLGFALVLVFVLGRCTAGGGDASADVEQLEGQVDTLLEENEALEQQIEALQAGGTDDGAEPASSDVDPTTDQGAADDTDSESGDDSADASEDAQSDPDVRTHEVQEGEILYNIAEQYYGDGGKYVLITEENGLAAGDPIFPGQVLRIPPDED